MYVLKIGIKARKMSEIIYRNIHFWNILNNFCVTMVLKEKMSLLGGDNMKKYL